MPPFFAVSDKNDRWSLRIVQLMPPPSLLQYRLHAVPRHVGDEAARPRVASYAALVDVHIVRLEGAVKELAHQVLTGLYYMGDGSILLGVQAEIEKSATESVRPVGFSMTPEIS